ncbi:DNA-directed RNA polymerase III subunit RPC4 [Balamuthia mandrillaris]
MSNNHNNTQPSPSARGGRGGARRIGNIAPSAASTSAAAAGGGGQARLSSLRSTPVTGGAAAPTSVASASAASGSPTAVSRGGVKKKSFTPKVNAPRRKKELEEADPGTLPKVLQNVKTEAPRGKQRTRGFLPQRKPRTFNTTSTSTAGGGPFMHGPPSQSSSSHSGGFASIGGFRKTGRKTVTRMEDIDPLNKYRPMSVPFVHPAKRLVKPEKKEGDDEEAMLLDHLRGMDMMGDVPVVKMEDEEQKKKDKQRKEEDAWSGGASQVKREEQEAEHALVSTFLNAEEDQLFFMQLPSHLPTSHMLEGNDDDDEEDEEQEGGDSTTKKKKKKKQAAKLSNISGLEEEIFESNMEKVEEGCMGKLLIYKSGKIKMQLGDILLDVTAGAQIGFKQEIAVISAEQKKFCTLGSCDQRLICTPDIDSLLDAEDEKQS